MRGDSRRGSIDDDVDPLDGESAMAVTMGGGVVVAATFSGVGAPPPSESVRCSWADQYICDEGRTDTGVPVEVDVERGKVMDWARLCPRSSVRNSEPHSGYCSAGVSSDDSDEVESEDTPRTGVTEDAGGLPWVVALDLTFVASRGDVERCEDARWNSSMAAVVQWMGGLAVE